MNRPFARQALECGACSAPLSPDLWPEDQETVGGLSLTFPPPESGAEQAPQSKTLLRGSWPQLASIASRFALPMDRTRTHSPSPLPQGGEGVRRTGEGAFMVSAHVRIFGAVPFP